MDMEKYIGFRAEFLSTLLNEKHMEYTIEEVWDTKKTKLGNELRIIKIEQNNNNLTIYVSYF